MKTVLFTVPGNPIPKQSFKVGKGRGYTPQRIKDWQELVADYAMLAMNFATPFRGPVGVSLFFRRETRHKADLDNLSKAVLDGMNKMVFEDDKQVHELHLYKEINKDNPGVTIHVWKIGE